MLMVQSTLYLTYFGVCFLYTCHGKIRREEPDYDHMEYGGILRETSLETASTDIDVMQAVKYAHLFIQKRFPWSLQREGELISSPIIKNLCKVKLVYTEDDWNPAELIFLVEHAGMQYSVTGPLDFGVTYTFQLEWRKKNVIFKHNIMLTAFPEIGDLNVFQHTFYIEYLNSTEDACRNEFGGIKSLYGDSYNFCKLSESLESFPSSQSIGGYQNSPYIAHQQYYENSQSHSTFCDIKGRDQVIGYQNPISTGFTVMTYNVWNMDSTSGRGEDYVERIKHLGQLIAENEADIIGFQEVRYEYQKGEHLGPNQVLHLADMLPGYQFIFQPGQLQPNSVDDGRTEEGVAIFSRFPIVRQDYILLFRNSSNSADTHQRVCLHAEIDVPLVGQVHVFVTHLSLSHEAREHSVVQIQHYMKKFREPVILLGDLNAEPAEKAVKFLRGELSILGESAESFIDVWMMMHGDRQRGFTFNALHKQLSKRIDYIFMRKSSWIDLKDVHIVDDKTRQASAASDHLPLKASFVIRTPPH